MGFDFKCTIKVYALIFELYLFVDLYGWNAKEIECVDEKWNSYLYFNGNIISKRFVNFIPQSVRNDANTILGCIRARRSGQLRIGRHQNIHTLLGHAYVWHLFRHQYRCAAESTHCHDESFISIDFRKFNIKAVLCPTVSNAVTRRNWQCDTRSREAKMHKLAI